MPSPLPPGASAVAPHVFEEPFRIRLEAARATAVDALLRERNSRGTWTGELSASALSTATAVVALTLVARGDPSAGGRLGALGRRGYDWLIRHQNPDGGWGDTTKSISNISTTTLAWAALGLTPEAPPGSTAAGSAAERWLTRAAGSLDPGQLVRAIERRYGDDRTFSIPILTLCALCGRLGPGTDGWRHVRPLPFELAALPQRWFGALNLPVVSYALPALIAMGQVRHGLRPSPNPLVRWLRNRCRARTLEKLRQLQPANGGFLEATPLTSFVTMSLAALGLTRHPVVRRGVAFLEASARSDGSWPIDTDLATWVTTLAVNSLGEQRPGHAAPPGDSHSRSRGAPTPAAPRNKPLPAAPAQEPDRSAGNPAFLPGAAHPVRDWLLQQQYRIEHPYTLAAPGGWAWTDLPGGVPDADDTAGALLALHGLDPDAAAVRAAAAAGVTWLLGLQNSDGGIPTFCRGWGRLAFDRSSPDLTAHAIRAWIAWRDYLPPPVQAKVEKALGRASRYLARTQRADGAWIPLWFGHQEDPHDENPLYGTARVVPALCALAQTGRPELGGPLARAIDWLGVKQNPDGGWAGAQGAASSMEETGLALEALVAAWASAHGRAEQVPMEDALKRGAVWLTAAMENGQWRSPAPIGFYFAKLWYHERLYPLIFATGALTKLAGLRHRDGAPC